MADNPATAMRIVVCEFMDAPGLAMLRAAHDVLYEPALVNYIMFRAKSKSAEFANPAEAKDYFASFQMYVGTTGADEKTAAGAPE